ncbi:DUF3618 domain-containing protein [Nocardia sp. CC201C]|uniref:DUF3618 domain-containing protein n=1 Tax=Nocardia sp. CC201C TaxID=3044575 RepID=UPI0024A89C8E|nr:DUF3618 domain-containing protein [Nocardia sp. CC201C]
MNQPDSEKKTAASVDELREQVEHTRAELGQTVEALAAKTDVKARAQDRAEAAEHQAAAKAEQLKHKTTDAAQQARSHPGLVLAGVAGVVIAVWAVRRRRNG